jgi:hypothetical protein
VIHTSDSANAYSTLRVKLPSFVVIVLRQRAEASGKTVSEILERLVLEDLMLDELQVMAEQVPGLGKAFTEWWRLATGRK